MSYDPKCEELARHFLADEDGDWARREKTVRAVAQHIQDEIESRISDLRPDEETFAEENSDNQLATQGGSIVN